MSNNPCCALHCPLSLKPHPPLTLVCKFWVSSSRVNAFLVNCIHFGILYRNSWQGPQCYFPKSWIEIIKILKLYIMMMIPNMIVVVATHVSVDGFFVLDGNSPMEYLLDYYSMQNFIIMEDNQSCFIKNMSAQLSTISSRYLFLLTNIFYSTAHIQYTICYDTLF